MATKSKKMPASLVAYYKNKNKGKSNAAKGKPKGVKKTGKMPPALAAYWKNRNKKGGK